MAKFPTMCQVPNKERVANLKLSGFRFGTLVYFCPNCDFQIEFARAVAPICRPCGRTLVLTTVSPELMCTADVVSAVRADSLATCDEMLRQRR